ncbi:MAG: hypothetical protein KC483_09745 [Nitrosarchaeum sp.]|nr:hypothetical protein [Nitrosarchaeum sp.]
MIRYRSTVGIFAAILSLVFLAFVLVGGLLMNKNFGISMSIILVIVPISAFVIILYILSRGQDREDDVPDRYTSNTSI